jgi:hypothetical protein
MIRQLITSFSVACVLLLCRSAAADDRAPVASTAPEATDIATDDSASDSGDTSSWTQERWFGPWQFELSASGLGGFGAKGFIYGGGIGLSLRHRSEFNAAPIVRLSEDFGVVFAILSMGITAAPKGIWLGNERGFDLRARYLPSRSKDASIQQRITLGIAPSFRITRSSSRLRFPAVLPSFIPEVGVGLVQDRAPEVLVTFHPFSMGFLLSDHVALELEASAMIAVPTDKSAAQVWALHTLSFAFR